MKLILPRMFAPTDPFARYMLGSFLALCLAGVIVEELEARSRYKK